MICSDQIENKMGGHVSHMGKQRNVYSIWWENMKDIGIDG